MGVHLVCTTRRRTSDMVRAKADFFPSSSSIWVGSSSPSSSAASSSSWPSPSSVNSKIHPSFAPINKQPLLDILLPLQKIITTIHSLEEMVQTGTTVLLQVLIQDITIRQPMPLVIHHLLDLLLHWLELVLQGRIRLFRLMNKLPLREKVE